MSIEIDLFDDTKVGPAARRLATCFNLSACMHNGTNPLESVREIFNATTGGKEIPAFNQDEKNYLKFKLIKLTATLGKGGLYGVSDLDDQAIRMIWTAEAMKLF